MPRHSQPWLPLGGLFCALAVMAGAFGAHGLEGHLDARSLGLWETAVRYLIYGGFGLLALGLVPTGGRWRSAAGWCLALGSAVFSLTVGALALGGPGMLGAVTPLGGLGMIAGFLLLGAAGLGRAGD